jgi:hypothetical protein
VYVMNRPNTPVPPKPCFSLSRLGGASECRPFDLAGSESGIDLLRSFDDGAFKKGGQFFTEVCEFLKGSSNPKS